MTKLSEIGERKAIEKLLSILEEKIPKNTLLSKNDDVLAVKDDKIALKIDGYSKSASLYPWEPLWKWGWKAVTAVVSDLSAKGYRTLGIAYSLGLQPETSLEDAVQIAQGIKEALREYSVFFLGGDLNSTRGDEWIDVAGIGELETEHPIPRRAAEIPEEELQIFTTLKNGYGYTGIVGDLYYRRGEVASEPYASFTPRAVVEFPEIAREINVLASMDVSDGLSITLWTLAEENGLEIMVENMPLNREVASYAEKRGINPIEAAFFGGEEYEIIFLTSGLEEKEVLNTCSRNGIRCYMLGKARRGRATVLMGDNRVFRGGWDQFSGSKIG